jgi:hypothetical protein
MQVAVAVDLDPETPLCLFEHATGLPPLAR